MRGLCPTFLVLVCLASVACGQQTMLERFTPKREAETARHFLALLAAHDFAAAEALCDPAMRGPALRSHLEAMAREIPQAPPTMVTVVGANTMSSTESSTANLTFEYEFPASWLVATVVVQRRLDQLSVKAATVKAAPQSLSATNRFTLGGKRARHYVVLALAVAIPLVIVYALVACVRMTLLRRKWLWLLFIAIGVVQVSLDWTSGAMAIQPFGVLALGAGVHRSGLYGPYVLTIACPVGALLFLFRRAWLPAQGRGLQTAGAP